MCSTGISLVHFSDVCFRRRLPWKAGNRKEFKLSSHGFDAMSYIKTCWLGHGYGVIVLYPSCQKGFCLVWVSPLSHLYDDTGLSCLFSFRGSDWFLSSLWMSRSQEILKFASWSDCCQHGAWYFLQEAENLGVKLMSGLFRWHVDDLPYLSHLEHG